MFADDTKCARHVKCAQDSIDLQADLNNLGSWSHHSKLQFKESKIVHLRCCSKDPVVNSKYMLNGSEVSTKDTHKDLVVFSSDLSFSSHYKMIASRACTSASDVYLQDLCERKENALHCPCSLSIGLLLLCLEIVPKEGH